MKKRHLLFFLLVSVLMLAGCSKEPLPKKYSITNNITFGSSTKFTIFECNEIGDKIYNAAETFSKGETKTFTAQDDAVKVKIYIKVESYFGNVTGYVQQVFYLQEGETKSIIIDGDTIIGSQEP